VQIIEAIQRRRDMPEWIAAVYRSKASLYLANNRHRQISEPALATIKAFAGETSAVQVTGTSPDQTGKTRLRLEFENPNHSFLVLQTTLGTGECSTNPVLHSLRLDGDAGWVLTTFAHYDDRLCYRISYYQSSPGWREWHEVERVKGRDEEAYQVKLP
jgi:hypothetical protein